MSAQKHSPGDYSRSSQVVRQWRILQQIDRQPYSISQLARQIDCHERTVRRDLYALEAAGFPLATDADHRWLLITPSRLTRVQLNRDGDRGPNLSGPLSEPR